MVQRALGGLVVNFFGEHVRSRLKQDAVTAP